MSAEKRNRNTEGLKQHAIRKSVETKQKVNQALERMKKDKQIINFNTVCNITGVSKAYLYRHFREEIEAWRQNQKGLASPKQVKNKMTDPNKDVLIAAKNKRIAELESEVSQLREQLKRLYAELYDED